VPLAIARRLKQCEVFLAAEVDRKDIASHWTSDQGRLKIRVATADVEPHDVALELLVCIGQALWSVISSVMHDAWRAMLCTELEEQVCGEIDQDALDAKRALLASRATTRARRRWEEYAFASFAGTVAEYVHCLWHDVTVRTGPEHLPPRSLQRRLALLAAWFPPARGRRLFAAAPAPE
jgi:hypothetical protein